MTANTINRTKESPFPGYPSHTVTFKAADEFSSLKNTLEKFSRGAPSISKIMFDGLCKISLKYGVLVGVTDLDTGGAAALCEKDSHGRFAIRINPKVALRSAQEHVGQSAIDSYLQEVENAVFDEAFTEHGRLERSGFFEETFKNRPPLVFEERPNTSEEFIKPLIAYNIYDNPAVEAGYSFDSIEAKSSKARVAIQDELAGTKFDIWPSGITSWSWFGKIRNASEMTERQIVLRYALSGHTSFSVSDYKKDLKHDLHTTNAGLARSEEGAKNASRDVSKKIVEFYKKRFADHQAMKVAFQKDICRRILCNENAYNAFIDDDLEKMDFNEEFMPRVAVEAAYEGKRIIEENGGDSSVFQNAVKELYPKFSFRERDAVLKPQSYFLTSMVVPNS